MTISFFMVISMLATCIACVLAVLDKNHLWSHAPAAALGLCWFIAETQLANFTCGG